MIQVAIKYVLIHFGYTVSRWDDDVCPVVVIVTGDFEQLLSLSFTLIVVGLQGWIEGLLELVVSSWCIVEMAVKTRNGTAPSAVGEGERVCKRQKVSGGNMGLICTMDEKENIQGKNTPEMSRVREDDVIYIRKRMSATRKHWAETVYDVKPQEAKEISPDDVLKLPTSMPTDDESICVVDGEKRQDMRRKTKSRVCSHQDSWVRKYPRESASPSCHEDPIDINALPDSCLVKIFSLSMDVDEQCSSLVAWRKNPCISIYPLVCQRWRNILSSPSEIWNTIVIDESSRKNLDGFKKWMARRQPSIQSVYVTTGHASVHNEEGIRELIEYLDPSVTNAWKSLKIDCTNINPLSFERFLNGAAYRFKGIKSLSLHGVLSLTKATMVTLRALPELEALSISFLRTSSQIDPFQEGDGSLSESLLHMIRLRSLTLNGTAITNIQPAIARLKNLTELKLESIIQVQSLPLMAVHLNNLTKISFKGSKSLFASTPVPDGDTPVGVVPGAERMFWMIRSLPKLEELNIDDCAIKEIPIIEGLPINTTLKRLSMNDNPDMVFKKGLAAFQGLESLTMRRCNMPCVSSAVTALSNLKYLDISNNGLVECNGLGKLKCLHVLKASHNQFPSIPRDIFSISGLKELELHGCIYLEFSSSLDFLVNAWPKLYRMVVTKGPRGQYQTRSLHWLHKLQECFDQHDRTHVVEVDDDHSAR